MKLLSYLISVVFVSVLAQSADFQIEQLVVTNGSVQVHFAASSDSYYLLYRGSDPSNVNEPIAASLYSESGAMIDATPLTSSAFYRVEKVSLFTPHDTDRDGLDDVWELRHRGSASLFNASDADLDLNGNGISDRME